MRGTWMAQHLTDTDTVLSKVVQVLSYRNHEVSPQDAQVQSVPRPDVLPTSREPPRANHEHEPERPRGGGERRRSVGRREKRTAARLH